MRMDKKPTLRDLVLDMTSLMVNMDKTLLEVLDALGGTAEEGTLLANYPRSGKKSVGIGTVTINTRSGEVVVPNEDVGNMSSPIPSTCQSLLLYCNREIDLELKVEGITTLSTSIFASWMRFADITFDEINIDASVATKLYIIVSNSKNGVPTMDRLIQKGIDENLTSWDHGHKTVTAAGTAENLTAMDVPDGIYLTIRALVGNVGNVYVGSSKANAEDVNKRLTLQPGESSSFKSDDTDLIWIDADNNGEGVEYWY